MATKIPWQYSKPNCGTQSVTLESWQDYSEYIQQELLEYTSYVFRGQARDEWQLESTLDRELKDVDTPGAIIQRHRHLRDFQRASRGRRGPSPRSIKSENEWWALGQHHGLATPLLDWTEAPFVALFFAFEKPVDEETEYRTVHALSESDITKMTDSLLREHSAEMAIHKLDSTPNLLGSALELDTGTSTDESHGLSGQLTSLFTPPPSPPGVIDVVRPQSDENANLVSQRGLFVRAPESMSIQDWIMVNFPNSTAGILFKIRIPNSGRDDCLKFLNRMNINRLSLFPDLYGASNYCNMKLQIKQY